MIKIVGAGISGLILARRLAEQGKDVFIYEASSKIGGLLYDYLKNGFYVSDSGVHIFHTNDKEVYEHISKFGSFIAYNHIVSADVYGKDFAINFPPNKNNRLSDEEFKNLYYFYSLKQWGKMPPQEVLDRCKRKEDNCLYFFRDKYVALPFYGWTNICHNIAEHENITILYNKEFTLNDIKDGDIIYYTGRLDKLFNYKYGEMQYRSIEIINKPKGEDNANVLNKSLPDCKYTRIINWRRCSPQVSTQEDLYGYEYSRESLKDEITPHYIVAGQDNIYEQYKQECSKYNIIPFGRIGSNKYINIDEAIKCAMTLPL